MNRKRMICLAAMVLLFSSCSLIPKEEELPEAPVLHTAQNVQYTQIAVARGDIVKTESISCKYQPAVEQTLRFAQSGEVIAHIYVKQGDVVHKGDLLAELDNSAVEQELVEQENVLAGLQLQLRQSKETAALCQQRVDILKPASAEDPQMYAAQLSAAEQALTDETGKIASLNSLLSIEQERKNEIFKKLSARQLRAEIDGIARSVLQKEGKADLLSNPGQTVCVISDLATASFTAQTEEGWFAVGDAVSIVYDDTGHDAVAEAVTAGDKNQVTVQFRLNLPDAALSAGKQGKIALVTDSRKNVLYLPTKAIVSLQNAKLVYYVDESGIKNSKIVTTGLEADGKVEIVDGLEEGELVIQ